MLLTLLKLKWLSMSSRFRHSRKKMWIALSFAGFFILPVYVFMNLFPLYKSWMTSSQLGIDAVMQFSTTSLTGMFFMLFFTSIPAALHYLYLSADNDLFTALPIQRHTLVAFNIIQVMIHNTGLYFAFALPVLAAMAAVVHLNFISIAAITLSCLFIILPSTLAVLFAGVLARIFPVKNSRFFSSLFMGFAFLLLWGLLQFVRFSKLNPGSVEFSWNSIDSFFALTHGIAFQANPAMWITRMIADAARLQINEALKWFALLLTSSATAFFFVLFLQTKLQSKQAFVTEVYRKSDFTLSSFTCGMLLKQEFKSKGRDPRLFQSSAMLNIIMIIFSLTNTFAFNSNSYVPAYFSVALFAVMGAVMQARTTLAFDGLFFQYKLFTPVALVHILWAKVLHSVLLMLPGIVISAFIITHKYFFPFLLGVVAILAILMLLLGVVLINIFMSTRTIRFNWNDFRELVGTNGRYMNMFLSLMWGLSAVVWLVLIPKQVIAFIIYFLYVWVCVLIFAHFTILRLKKIQWNY